MKIAFSSGDFGTDIVSVYSGDISPIDGSILWSSELFTFVSNNSGIPQPVRIISLGTNDIIAQYAMGENGTPSTTHLNRYSGGAYSDILLLTDSGDWLNDYPYHECFDQHTNGISIIFESFYDDIRGNMLRVSTDYGVTWGESVPIDYMQSFLGNPTLYGQNYVSYGSISLQVDEDSGIFYLLIPYYRNSNWSIGGWILLKSTNGTNWELVKDLWPDASGFSEFGASMAVSSGHIYVWFYYDPTGFDVNSLCNYSHDGGVTWESSEIIGDNWRNKNLIAEGETVLAYTWDNQAADIVVIRRSLDGGLTWSDSLRIEGTPTLGAGMVYPSVRASNGVFAVTYCEARFPQNGVTWTDSQGSHSMDGEGQAHLCVWISVDMGETWNLQVSPISADSNWQQSLDVFAIEAPASCLATSAISIDPATMILSGTGTGANATEWQVVRVSDGTVMDSGTGESASFSFVAAYDTEYQLQFRDGA